MNTAIIVLIVVTVVFTISIISFLIFSIKSKSYLSYRQKLIAFEEKKKRIEAELERIERTLGMALRDFIYIDKIECILFTPSSLKVLWSH